MHQDEITSLPKDILKFIIKKCKHINDLRTIFIAHDKRLLTILSRDDIMKDYLSPAYHNIIKKHRIHSILPSSIECTSSNLYKDIIENKNEWLLKPYLLGKGQGILFGKNMSTAEWEKLIYNCMVSNDMKVIIQKYIQQENFDIVDATKNNLLEYKQHKVVGTLLCFNDLFIGPGIFRTSADDLIALSRGGNLLFPLLNDTNYIDSNDKSIKQPFIYEPPNYKNHHLLELNSNNLFYLSNRSLKDTPLYEKSLIEHGIVLIQLGFEDLTSEFMLKLIEKIGVPHAHSSKGDDYLWDIKAMCNNNEVKTNARSHSDHEFLMHTDASFELNTNIPRYFGLHVLQNDRFNGGQSLLLSLNDVINNLSKNNLNTLKTHKFKFKIPNEFRKNNNLDFNEGPIISCDGYKQHICRYRSDIIIERDKLHDNVKSALNCFESLIDIKKSNLISYFQLKSNTIILVDNCRYLHGRTEIIDSIRHLRRIRFQAKNNELIPNF